MDYYSHFEMNDFIRRFDILVDDLYLIAMRRNNKEFSKYANILKEVKNLIKSVDKD